MLSLSRFTLSFGGFLLTEASRPSLTELLSSSLAIVDIPDEGLLEYPMTSASLYNLGRPLCSGRSDQFGGTRDASVLPLLESLMARHPEKSSASCMYLFELMVDRPDWYFFHRSEIMQLRMCTTGIVGLIEESGDLEESSRESLDAFVRRILPVIYSSELEKALRVPEIDTPIPSDPSALFRGYMQSILGEDFSGSSSGLMGQIAGAIRASEFPCMDTLNPSERKFFERLIASNFSSPYVEHAGQFLTTVWGRLGLAGRDRETLGLFKIIFENVPDYDAIDWRISTSEIVQGHRPGGYAKGRTHFHIVPGMGFMRSAFITMPGMFIERLYEANRADSSKIAALEACFPPEYFEARNPDWDCDLRQLYNVMQDRANIFPFYQCLIDLVMNERVTMPETERELSKSTSTLLYLLMITKSADAILGQLV